MAACPDVAIRRVFNRLAGASRGVVPLGTDLIRYPGFADRGYSPRVSVAEVVHVLGAVEKFVHVVVTGDSSQVFSGVGVVSCADVEVSVGERQVRK